MTEWWVVEVDQGVGAWTPLCHCPSQTRAERMAEYFRHMNGLSGKTIRVRQYGRAPQSIG